MDLGFLTIALKRLGVETVSRLQQQLVNDGTTASSELISSISSKVVKSSLEIYMLKYGGAIDEGIRKGGRPANGYRIKEWLKVKGIPLKDYKTNKYIERTESNYNKIAFLISRSIGREGTLKDFQFKGSNFIDRAINNTLDEFDDALLEAFDKELTKEFDKIKTNG